MNKERFRTFPMVESNIRAQVAMREGELVHSIFTLDGQKFVVRGKDIPALASLASEIALLMEKGQ